MAFDAAHIPATHVKTLVHDVLEIMPEIELEDWIEAEFADLVGLRVWNCDGVEITSEKALLAGWRRLRADADAFNPREEEFFWSALTARDQDLLIQFYEDKQVEAEDMAAHARTESRSGGYCNA